MHADAKVEEDGDHPSNPTPDPCPNPNQVCAFQCEEDGDSLEDGADCINAYDLEMRAEFRSEDQGGARRCSVAPS